MKSQMSQKRTFVLKGQRYILIKIVGLEDTRKIITEKAVGAVVIPKNENSVITLSYIGQCQAMVHHDATVLGCYLDSGEPRLVQLSNRDMAEGRIALFFCSEKKFSSN